MGKDSKRVAVLAGDGIGPEVTREALRVLAAAKAKFSLPVAWDELDWNADRYLKTGETLPPGGMEKIRGYDAILVGAYGDPRVPDMAHARDILLGMRFQLDLYVNYRPVKLYDARLCPLKDRTEKDVDMVIFRENTEGLYVGVGGNFKKGTPDEVALQEDVNTRKGVERIIRHAFEFARATGRRKVCMSDKSNALQYGHDLWQRVFKDVQKEYADIESSHLYIDALTMQMVKNPAQFGVIVTCNMFGDIITDLGAQIQGGLGVAPSGNLHPGKTGMFEPIHGSAPKYAGQNTANPAGAILSVAMMLEFLGWKDAATAIEAAVVRGIKEGKTARDLGGSMGTKEVGEWVAENLR